MAPVSQHTLPPLLQSFRTRIAARGPVKMEWRIIGKPHASVMTHRASVFGEDQPDTAFRQAVIRIESTQELSMSYDDGKKGRTPKPSSKKGIRWSPSDAKKEEGSGKEDKVEFADNGKPRRVVEYLVLQRRVISGKEDTEWKAWGFAKESTPESIEDDAVYWRKMLNGQAAEA
jgi:protein MBA1